MKFLTAIIALMSLNAFAQERIELNSKEVSVNASEALIVRTNKTPKKVEITFTVPLEKSVCERHEIRHVLRTSSFHCGEDVRYTRVRVGRDCIRSHPETGKCLTWRDVWQERRIATPRTCMVPERYCAQYGTATSFKKDKATIEFKDLPALGDSESESFYITADQKSFGSNNVIYDVTPHETLMEYKVKQKRILWIKRDSYVIQLK